MKVYITESKLGDAFHEGPTIVAETFAEAEETAELYAVNVVGFLDVVITSYNEDNYKRVLH